MVAASLYTHSSVIPDPQDLKVAEKQKETESKHSSAMSRRRNQAAWMCTGGWLRVQSEEPRTVLKSALGPNHPPTLALLPPGCDGLGRRGHLLKLLYVP